MNIFDICKRIHEEGDARWQALHEAMEGITMAKGGGSRVTFITDAINPTQVMTSTEPYVGVVIWVPRDWLEPEVTP